MDVTHASGGPSLLVTLGISVVVLGILLMRNRAPRRLRPELLWISLIIVIPLASAYFIFVYHPTDPLALGELVVAAVAGLALGWWRGKLTRIEVHPETHDITMQVSSLGMVLIILVFAGRRVAEVVAPPGHLAQITSLLVAFAVATVVTARVEMWLRARRLLAVAKAG
jgi:hypothetical protein